MTTTSAPVFATYAPGMREQQLAVVPIGPGRKSYVNSFSQWRYRPGSRASELHELADVDPLAMLPVARLGTLGRGAAGIAGDAAREAASAAPSFAAFQHWWNTQPGMRDQLEQYQRAAWRRDLRMIEDEMSRWRGALRPDPQMQRAYEYGAAGY